MPRKIWNTVLLSILALTNGSFALTSGPAMPEYNDFESVENTDLVNLATGDFTYTIPIMTVPGPGLGFPIVLDYHGGIQPEQEASWVGLGWNIQAGAITRRVNNFPDDFKGILIEEKFESQYIHGWMASFSWNGVTVGVSWDSEIGLGGMVGYSYSIGGEKSPFSVGVTAGVNGVYEGLGINFSVSSGTKLTEGIGLGAGASIGLSTQSGVSAGIGGGISASQSLGQNVHTSASLASIGVSLSSKRGTNAGASVGVGVSASITTKGQVTQENSSMWLPMWTPWTGYMELNAGNYDVYIDGLQEDRYFGFLYSDKAGTGCNPSDPTTCYRTSEPYGDRCTGCGAAYRMKKLDYNNAGDFISSSGNNPKWIKFGSTGEDIYSVQTQGMSGTFKPYRTQDGDYYSSISNQEYTKQAACQGFIGDWFGATCDRRATSDFGPAYENYRDYHTSTSTERVVWRFNEETGGGLYTNPLQRESDPIVTTTSKKIESIFSETGRINGWVMTASNGVRYLYTLPQYNYVQKNLSSENYNLDQSTRRETPTFAYAWLLTAILSPDYVQIGTDYRSCLAGKNMDGENVNVCLPRGDTLGQPGDIGGWVRFDYTQQGIIGWRSPITGADPTGYTAGDASKVEGYSASMGLKAVAFLSSINTPTHEAVFNIAEESRLDDIPQAVSDIGSQAEAEPGPSTNDPQECGRPPASYASEPRFSYNIKFSKENLPPGTKVSIYAERHRVWSKWDCEFGFLGLPSCGEFCKTGVREDLLQTMVLPDQGTGGDYNIPIASSTWIEHVRVVVGDYSNINGASSLGYLRSITLKNKKFGKEASSVRFAYDYSLGQGSPNSESTNKENGGDKGRLTLLGVQIGASSQGPWNPPYRFQYGGQQIKYGKDKHDYWGDYCANCKEKQRTPDGNANVWNLNKVTTPAGSELEVQYEPKAVDYVEGVPTIINGNDIGKYFEIDNSQYNVPVANPQSRTNFSQVPLPSLPPVFLQLEDNHNLIPKEIADKFKNKYVAFLGSFDIPYPDMPNVTGNIDLSQLQIPGASSYILETPKVYIEDFIPPPTGTALSGVFVYKILSHGMWDEPEKLYTAPEELRLNTSLINSMINSSRLKCTDGSGVERTGIRNCKYYVGREVGPNNVIQFGNFALGCYFDNLDHPQWAGYGMRYQFSNPWRVEKSPQHRAHARYWAIFDTPPANFVRYGGGVRVSHLKFKEPFSGKENQVQYTYKDAATPTLPDPLSNYSSSIRVGDAQGMKAYVGNPGILHGKVTATFGTAPKAYSTEYNFVTSKDLPVRFASTPDYDGVNGHVDARIKILDRSGLWGSLWKKVEKNSSGNTVRTDISRWASRISSDWKSKLLMGNLNMDLDFDGENVLKGDDADIRVVEAGATQLPYFGVTQKLWGNRYIDKDCEDKGGQDKDNCVKALGGVKTAQVELLRFSPLARNQSLIQDGLAKSTEENLFDFQTGSPLLSIQSNVRPDNGVDYFATLKELAYHQNGTAYAGMKSKNMLEQEFSNTSFRFGNVVPVPDDFIKDNSGKLPTATLQKVIASEFTTWRDYSPSSSSPQYRMQETFKLKSRTGFDLPNPANAGNVKWQSQGLNVSYDPFGHVDEFENTAVKQRNAQFYDYGKSLPTASVMNAGKNEIFYQSFETTEFQSSIAAGIGQSTGTRSKTGNGSVAVPNCLEPTGGTPKPACGTSNSTLMCFSLPALPANQTYIASAWYYDEYQGSNPNNPSDPIYINKQTQVTRPGLFIGKEAGAGCQVENHPNGAMVAPGVEVPPVGNEAPNAAQRAMGERNWKRIWSEFTPGPGCGTNGILTNALVCVYASKGKPGSDVIYDELRVRPKNSLMTTYAYDHRGKMISTADENEVTKHFDYDVFGSLKGIRNDDHVLLSEKARKYHPDYFEPYFPDRDPISYLNPETNSEQKVCEAPEFKGIGDAPKPNYTLLGSTNNYIASIDPTGKKVCTSDYGGTASITIDLPDIGKQVVVPIQVNGSQVAMRTYRCLESGLKPVEGISLGQRATAKSHCQFDYSDLELMVQFKTKGSVPTGYGVTVELKRLITRPNWVSLEDAPWNCIDGVYNNSCGTLNAVGRHAHLRFSGFSCAATSCPENVVGITRAVVPNAFPDPESENRFMGVMKNSFEYLIITNNKGASFSPYAPTLFKLNPVSLEPTTVPLDNGRSLYRPFWLNGPLNTPGSLKIEFGFAPKTSNQMDFEALAEGEGTVGTMHYKMLVDKQATSVKNQWIETTVRAYVK